MNLAAGFLPDICGLRSILSAWDAWRGEISASAQRSSFDYGAVAQPAYIITRCLAPLFAPVQGPFTSIRRASSGRGYVWRGGEPDSGPGSALAWSVCQRVTIHSSSSSSSPLAFPSSSASCFPILQSALRLGARAENACSVTPLGP